MLSHPSCIHRLVPLSRMVMRTVVCTLPVNESHFSFEVIYEQLCDLNWPIPHTDKTCFWVFLMCIFISCLHISKLTYDARGLHENPIHSIKTQYGFPRHFCVPADILRMMKSHSSVCILFISFTSFLPCHSTSTTP
jgi:hypothetical protein